MVAVRLAALYGPLERPSASRPKISAVGQLMNALTDSRPITVAGASVRRDWTYVFDAANAVLALLEAEQLNHALYNIGCGTSVSWRQVVDTFVAHGLRATWNDDEANADISMKPEHERLVMDISRLQKDTGFVPRHSMDTGIADYLSLETPVVIDD